jgi:hypothetical protein
MPFRKSGDSTIFVDNGYQGCHGVLGPRRESLRYLLTTAESNDSGGRAHIQFCVIDGDILFPMASNTQ